MTLPFDRALALIAQVPHSPEGQDLCGATADQVKHLEQPLQQTLPAELSAWLRRCNGIVAGPGVLYGARPTEPPLDIGAARSMWPEWAASGWIPVATDGTGNVFVIQGSDPHHRTPVYFVDCSEDPSRLAYVVASSLDRFLISLLERELGQLGWPFDSAYSLAKDPHLEAVHGAPLPWEA